MVRQYAQLDIPVHSRTIVDPDGNIRRLKRSPLTMYGCPKTADDRAFIWSEKGKRFVVAVSSETHKIGARSYGCYHAVKTRNAAIMLAHALIID